MRNAQDVIDRCVESILGQEFTDLELVVCDNASDDETVTILQGIASGDSRVRLIVNETNIGSHENMNRTLEHSCGTFFRWISSDDWLEPRCLSTCIGTLRGRDDAIGVTTDFTIHTSDGATRFEEYRGEFPTSGDAARRFNRMLWFFHAGDAKYDPIYGVYRRDALLDTRRLRRSEQTDWLLAAELALRGPIVHVHERLAHRTRSYARVDPDAHRSRLDPAHATELRSTSRRLRDEFLDLVESAPLTDDQRRACRRAIRRFVAQDATAGAAGTSAER